MTKNNTLLLYVNDVPESIAFYEKMLEQQPVEQSASFALFILSSGLALALWDKKEVQPVPTIMAGGCELGFKLNDAADIDRLHQEWCDKGVKIALARMNAGFGRSFMALDPDGHRLRFYTIGQV
ncbi:putative enzyme related to lactoylglutathione lyase [Paenochrobactrum gallinarii]|uniref:Putative enzyme related to lactoylglutathione lyase n=1 Tax=Paenochrobactrum gallinarii TaxID=643673 RepID=A0A841M494_9HYPH|nr:VOC family protein [Paenochrobactrum gallinarii]MBB6260978.1 putative enzyme related to lactoylglutathione lyase [Paenochrobactrum gallinarii]